MSLIFITHDLGIIAEIADHVAVMYQGNIVESGSVWKIFSNPQHPYTKGLIRCLPRMNQTRPRLEQIKGVMPSLLKLPEGCYFRDRCPEAGQDCRVYPPEREVEGRRVTCHRVQ